MRPDAVVEPNIPPETFAGMRDAVVNLMDERYAQTVRLLLTTAPTVFNNDVLTMKSRTAIISGAVTQEVA